MRKSTQYFKNLLGGFIDGNNFVPVRFGLKHIEGKKPILYVVIDQNIIEKSKIETKVSKTTTLQKDGSKVSRLISNIKLSQIVPFVNSKDLLRYLPDDMLSQEQKQIKADAIAETIKYRDNKNDKKYAVLTVRTIGL